MMHGHVTAPTTRYCRHQTFLSGLGTIIIATNKYTFVFMHNILSLLNILLVKGYIIPLH